MSHQSRLSALLLCAALAGCSDSPSDQKSTDTTVAAVTAVSTLNAKPGIDSVFLNWSAVDGAYGYNLYHATAPGIDKATTERITVNGTSSQQTGLTPGSDHYYRVSALTAAGEGSLSPELHVVLALAPATRDDAAPY